MPILLKPNHRDALLITLCFVVPEIRQIQIKEVIQTFSRLVGGSIQQFKDACLNLKRLGRQLVGCIPPHDTHLSVTHLPTAHIHR